MQMDSHPLTAGDDQAKMSWFIEKLREAVERNFGPPVSPDVVEVLRKMQLRSHKRKMKRNDAEGKYGQLEVIDRTWGLSAWKCRCSCGRICVVPVSQLRNEETVSCGCVKQVKPPLKIVGGFRFQRVNERL